MAFCGIKNQKLLFKVDSVSIICLEDSTERSESNPGRSLGIKNKKKAAVWKTVPLVEGCRLLVVG